MPELEPASDDVAADYLAHDPELLGLFGLHQPPGQAELLRDGGGEHGARGRVARRDAARQLRIAEERLPGTNPEIAQQREGEPTGKRGAVDGSDDRAAALADRLEGERARLDEALAVFEVAAELRRIHP